MAEAQSIVKDDRGGTVVPEETTRLKTPGPCKCGGRIWKGPFKSNLDEAYYFARCYKCGSVVILGR